MCLSYKNILLLFFDIIQTLSFLRNIDNFLTYKYKKYKILRGKTKIDYIMDKLFSSYTSYENYKNILEEPLNADERSIVDKDFCHEQYGYVIKNNKLEIMKKNLPIKNNIEYLYFSYVDFGEREWDDKYWFFVGKIRTKKNIYISYESGCCGTGFGLGSKSTICLADSKENLYDYGLTNKQRELINSKLKEKFVYKDR